MATEYTARTVNQELRQREETLHLSLAAPPQGSNSRDSPYTKFGKAQRQGPVSSNRQHFSTGFLLTRITKCHCRDEHRLEKPERKCLDLSARPVKNAMLDNFHRVEESMPLPLRKSSHCSLLALVDKSYRIAGKPLATRPMSSLSAHGASIKAASRQLTILTRPIVRFNRVQRHIGRKNLSLVHPQHRGQFLVSIRRSGDAAQPSIPDLRGKRR